MAENSKIQWTDHTFNCWRGCTKVSSGCANCYAETLSGRNPGTLGIWGPNGSRVVAAESQWRLPLKWNRDAACSCGGGFQCVHSAYCPQANRPRVFCASLADVFENWMGPMVDAKGERLYHPNNSWEDHSPWIPASDTGGDEKPITMGDVRTRLFRLIDDTPNLDWLLLTKRPEYVLRMMPKGYMPRPNVWIGTSVENQQAADERIPHLTKIPAVVRFLSIEPMLGAVDLSQSMRRCFAGAGADFQINIRNGVDWVIVGGESGHGARSCHVEWIRSIMRQCQWGGTPCFVKQLGSNPEGGLVRFADAGPTTKLIDRKGGDPEEWPEDLRVREFPR